MVNVEITKDTRYNNQKIINNQIPIIKHPYFIYMHNFDLEPRTTEFAKRVIRLCKALEKNSMNSRLVGQIVGSSGSIGANYREANDALGKKDFIHRLRIARKEAKETIHWLELIEEANSEFSSRMKEIKQEAKELKNILSTIIENSTKKDNEKIV